MCATSGAWPNWHSERRPARETSCTLPSKAPSIHHTTRPTTLLPTSYSRFPYRSFRAGSCGFAVSLGRGEMQVKIDGNCNVRFW